MRTIFFLVLLIVTSTAAAQASKDSTRLRHELHVDTRSALLFMMGGRDNYPQAGIMYKLSPNSRGAFRIALDYFLYTETNYADPILNTNSFNLHNSRAYTDDHLQGSIGYEWLRGKKKLKQFYGADIAYKHYSSVHVRRQEYTLVDTCSTCTNGIAYSTVTEHWTTEYFTDLFQLNAFYGIKYPLWKKFMISAQAGLGLSYRKGTAERTNNMVNVPSRYRFHRFSLTEMPLINDVSLVYCF